MIKESENDEGEGGRLDQHQLGLTFPVEIVQKNYKVFPFLFLTGYLGVSSGGVSIAPLLNSLDTIPENSENLAISKSENSGLIQAMNRQHAV